jgi:ribosomal protein S18 acetylase RimI-like enzyme
VTIRVVDEADPAIVARLGEEITAFNLATAGIPDARGLFAAVHDGDGQLVGAVHGWTWGGSCSIEHLWVRGSDRGRGTGSALLTAAVREAEARGCRQVAVTTYGFQAPDFYRRHGFEVVGEVPDHPRGHSFLLLRRRLNTDFR